MKKLIILFPLLILCSIISAQTNIFPSTGAAGVGTTTPDPSSLLEIKSTSKGILVPRMTQTQRNAIATPATGLLIFQTNKTPGYYYYSGSAWTAISSSGANTFLNNLTSPTSLNQSLIPGITNSVDLGSSTDFWRNAYISGNVSIDGLTIGLGAGGQLSNTAIGNGALYSNSTGDSNTANGYQALYYNTMGSYNTADGYKALSFNTTGYNNTANGTKALYSNTIGYGNTANGGGALTNNTTGFHNTAVGSHALGSNTTGYDNTANGYQALDSNRNGNLNTAIGYQALYFNNGYSNTANGCFALYFNTTGSGNIANGYQALYYNTEGSSNIAVGNSSLLENTTGSDNVVVGSSALFNNKSGNDNSAIGELALYTNDSGSENTGLGELTNTSSFHFSNTTMVGYSAECTASNQVRIGNGSITSVGSYTDWTNISDARVKQNIKQNVPGLAFINLLKPVTYNYDLDAADKIVWPDARPTLKDHPQQGELQKLDAQAKQEKQQITYTGFLAQDVETAAKSIGYDFSGVDAPKNDKDLYGLRYAEFVVPLVKAVQELDASQKQETKSQNDEISSLKAEIAELKLEVSNLQSAKNGNDPKLQTSNMEYQTASLQQNSPNPFSQNTIISYFLPQSSINAVIKIYSLQGEELKSVSLNVTGNGQISINGNSLQSGAYVYVLIVDGKTIDTKQMILTK